MRCSNCNTVLNDDFKFCPKCGVFVTENKKDFTNTSLDKRPVKTIYICEVCGEDTSIDNGFCEKCGAKLSGKEKDVASEKIKLAENKVLAFKEKKQNREQKFSKPGAKENKSNATNIVSEKNKTLNINQIIWIAGGLIIFGFILLWVSGVFDSNPVRQMQGNNVIDSKINLEEIQKIEELETLTRNDTTNIANVLDLAHKLNDSGFFERAINYYKMYLRSNPGNADVHIDLGVCFYELKLYNNAKTEMKKGLRINPQHQIGLFNLGIVNFSEGKLDSAKYWWKKSIAINENSEIGSKAKHLIESN